MTSHHSPGSLRESSPTPSQVSQLYQRFTPTTQLSPERFGQVESESSMLREFDLRRASRSQQQLEISMSSTVNTLNYSASDIEMEMPESLNATAIHDPHAILIDTTTTSIVAEPSRLHFAPINEVDVDLDSLISSGDAAAIRTYFQQLQAALTQEKSLNQELTGKTRTLTEEVQEARERAEAEARHARDAEKVAMEATAAKEQLEQKPQPMLVKEGLPIILASPGLMSPAAVRRPTVAAAPTETDEKENMPPPSFLSPVKQPSSRLELPHASPAQRLSMLLTPSRQYMISPGRPTSFNTAKQHTLLLQAQAQANAQTQAIAQKSATRHKLIKKSLYEPIVRTNKLAKSYSQDIKEELGSFATDFNETCKLIVGALRNHDSELNATGGLYARYQTERRQRQRLHDQLLEMQGNIRVFARVRPIMSNTAANASGGADLNGSLLLSNPNEGGRLVQEMEQDATRFIDDQTLGHSGKIFEFDKILHQQCSQEEVYKNVAPFIQSVIDGYNVCIFAYGQTGSGKTYTMEGKENNPGVNIRALKHLFSMLSARVSNEFEFKAKLSAVEIYNETPKDLLVEPNLYKKSIHVETSKLEIHQNQEGQIVIPGLIEKPVSNVEDVMTIMNNFVKPNRTTAATSMNEYSSRSHSLLFLTVESQTKDVDGMNEKTVGRLVLIDLAGSERIKKSEAQGQALKEASYINKSLSALGDVISALKTKAAHIPFRNSKLTYLLSDCLGGNSKVLMFAQISPSVSDGPESACTLQFASRVRAVQLGPAKSSKKGAKQQSLVKLMKVESSLQEKETQLERVLTEMKLLREEIQQERAQNLTKLSSIQSTHSERIRALEAELSKKQVALSAVQEQEQQHLIALKAKEREIFDLKLARNQIPVIESFSPIPNEFASFASTTTANSIALPQHQGTNLLDTSFSTIPPPQFDEADMSTNASMTADDIKMIDMDDASEDKENPPAVPKRLSGSKRKDSPEKVQTSHADQENVVEEEVKSKKMKLGATKVLGASSAVNMIVPPAAATTINKPTTLAPPKSQFALKLKDLKSTPKTKSKAVSAWISKSVPIIPPTITAGTIPPIDAGLDDSFDRCLESITSTPVATNGGKTVRFGATEIKFISPSPPIPPISTVNFPAVSALASESARVRTRSSKTSLGVSGGAKRATVKNPSAPAWNTSVK